MSCLLALFTEARDCHMDAALTGLLDRELGGLRGDLGLSLASFASLASLLALARFVILQVSSGAFLQGPMFGRDQFCEIVGRGVQRAKYEALDWQASVANKPVTIHASEMP